MANSKKAEELEKQIEELTADLQRVRADFENYRKRTEADRMVAYNHGQEASIVKLLPTIDNIDRAIAHLPDDLKDNQWAQGVAGLSKSLEKSLGSLGLQRIKAEVGLEFNPELHEAVQFDEDSEGSKEVIAEVLQAGYTLGDTPIRPAMVRAKRQ